MEEAPFHAERENNRNDNFIFAFGYTETKNVERSKK
jgi:hypothetical protein